jgi:hypothetical protein
MKSSGSIKMTCELPGQCRRPHTRRDEGKVATMVVVVVENEMPFIDWVISTCKTTSIQTSGMARLSSLCALWMSDASAKR